MGRRKDDLRESDACSSCCSPSNVLVEQLRHFDQKNGKSVLIGVHCDGSVVAKFSRNINLFRKEEVIKQKFQPFAQAAQRCRRSCPWFGFLQEAKLVVDGRPSASTASKK